MQLLQSPESSKRNFSSCILPRFQSQPVRSFPCTRTTAGCSSYLASLSFFSSPSTKRSGKNCGKQIHTFVARPGWSRPVEISKSKSREMKKNGLERSTLQTYILKAGATDGVKPIFSSTNCTCTACRAHMSFTLMMANHWLNHENLNRNVPLTHFDFDDMRTFLISFL